MKKICEFCEIVKYHKSGWAIKSPPKEKWKNTFQKRWFILATVKLCRVCSDLFKPKEKDSCLMLFYYADENETKLKGAFKVENAEVEAEENLPEGMPGKQKQKRFLLSCFMPDTMRKLYLFFTNEMERDSWLNAFIEHALDVPAKATEEIEVEEESYGKDMNKFFPMNDSTLQRELLDLKKNREESSKEIKSPTDYEDFLVSTFSQEPIDISEFDNGYGTHI